MLSGGDCGARPGGAPTAWKSESIFGIAATPATRTAAGARPGRLTLISSPTPACRLAAVWLRFTTRRKSALTR